MKFYISDLHLGDKRVFELCKRPFSSLEEYEEELIKRWNSKVKDDDDVYVLGDLAEGSVEKVKNFFSRAKGRKHLIVGNHDEEFVAEYFLTQAFVGVERLEYIRDEGRLVCVCHYPILDWFSGNEIIYLVYGHIHNKTEADGKMYDDIKRYYLDKPAFNASVDVINYEPVSLDELINIKGGKKHDTHIN